MINIEFEIKILPPESSGHKVITLTEGELVIFIDGQTFLKADGILLVEFASIISKWLSEIDRGLEPSFHYESMDFEETPILELKMTDDGSYRLFSVWQLIPNEKISLDDFVYSAKSFLRRFILTFPPAAHECFG